MILCYSRSYFIRNAVFNLAQEEGAVNVYCFHERVRFLACATLLNDAKIVVDTFETPIADIIWLQSKLRERLPDLKINYLANSVKSISNHSLNFNVLSDLQGVRVFLRPGKISHCSDIYRSLQEAIKKELKNTLCYAYRELLQFECVEVVGRENYIAKYGKRCYLNRRYQINKRLRFDTRQEYNSLLIILSAKKYGRINDVV